MLPTDDRSCPSDRDRRRRRGRWVILPFVATLACLSSSLAAFASPPGPASLPPVEALVDTNTPGPDPLTLEKARMRHAVGRANGSLRIAGMIDTRDQGATFEQRLLAGLASAHVHDGGSFAADLALTGCGRLRRGFRCRSEDKSVVCQFRASDNPGVVRMNRTAKRLSAEITGAGQPRGPISVLFSDGGGVDRPGVLADCDSAGKHALRCKH